jgi:YfiH family protein
VAALKERKAALSRAEILPAAITIPVFAEGLPGFVHSFGTKSGWQPLAMKKRQGELKIVTVTQVHGTETLLIPGRMSEAEIREAACARGYDAIITDRLRTWVTVRTADCVPILLADDGGVVASVHAGWRGTVDGIAGKVVGLMRNTFGCKLDSLRAAIGPAIGRCCYEVDEPVMAPVKRAFPYWSEALEETTPGRGQLALRRLNRLILEDAGVDPRRIAEVNLCTSCHSNLFYSYRRDGAGTRHMTSGIALIE